MARSPVGNFVVVVMVMVMVMVLRNLSPAVVECYPTISAEIHYGDTL
jgi:hypothetical protein